MGNSLAKKTLQQHNIPIINLDRVQIETSQIGKGGYGTVWKGVYKGQEVAIKIFHASYQGELSPEQLEEWMESMRQLCSLEHRNLVKCLGVCIDGKQRGLVMEFANLGNLRQHVRKTFSAKRTLFVIRALANSLIYLHNQRIIHRDIKPQNILMHKEDGKTIVKLTDYDLTQKMQYTQQLTPEMRGTIRYTPPEIYTMQQVSPKTDIFGVGMVAYECTTGLTPFHQMHNEYTIIRRLMDGERPELPQDMNEDLRELICDCWHNDPTKRPTAEELLVRCDQILSTLQ